jgi:hypothetical protein
MVQKMSVRTPPGDMIAAMGNVSLWSEPYDENPHATQASEVEKGSLGLIIASVGHERLVAFSKVMGWTNANNLAKV